MFQARNTASLLWQNALVVFTKDLGLIPRSHVRVVVVHTCGGSEMEANEQKSKVILCCIVSLKPAWIRKPA